MTNAVLKLEPIKSLDPAERERLASEKAHYIAAKIQESQQNIQNAKNASEAAEKFKNKWYQFGSGEKVNAVSSALTMTNEAVSELNTIIREVLNFSILNIDFARTLNQAMAKIVKDGFKDRDGNVVQLTKDSEEVVQFIMNQAEQFTVNQETVEQKQQEIDLKVHEIFKISKESVLVAQQLGSKLQQLADEKDKIDKEQYQRLTELESGLNKKKIIDDAQQKQIDLLIEYTIQKDKLDNIQTIGITKLQDKVKHLTLISYLSFGIALASCCYALFVLLKNA